LEGYTQWLADHGGISPLYRKEGFPAVDGIREA
jgi:hypothetical protein